MTRKASYLLIIVLLLLSSCRPQAEFPPQEAIETWGDLFRGFWSRMNTQYVFWNLDSPGSEWDGVYDEYAPLFDAIEGQIWVDEAATDKALRYFYQIVKELSDCHYSLSFYENKEDEEPIFSFSKYYYNLLLSSGHDDEEIYGFFKSGNTPDVSGLRDTIATVLSDSFGLSLSPGFSGFTQPKAYLSECYVFTSPGDQTTCYAVGKTEDGISAEPPVVKLQVPFRIFREKVRSNQHRMAGPQSLIGRRSGIHIAVPSIICNRISLKEDSRISFKHFSYPCKSGTNPVFYRTVSRESS